MRPSARRCRQGTGFAAIPAAFIVIAASGQTGFRVPALVLVAAAAWLAWSRRQD